MLIYTEKTQWEHEVASQKKSPWTAEISKKHSQWNYHLVRSANAPWHLFCVDRMLGLRHQGRVRPGLPWKGTSEKGCDIYQCFCLSVSLSCCLSLCLHVCVSSCLSHVRTWIRVIKSRCHWLISANLTKDSKYVISKCECKRIHQDMCMKPSNKI